MEACSMRGPDGSTVARARSVCILEPTKQSPGAAKSGLSQYRAVMRAARQLAVTSRPGLTISYYSGLSPDAIDSADEFEEELRKAEQINRNTPKHLSEFTRRVISGSSKH